VGGRSVERCPQPYRRCRRGNPANQSNPFGSSITPDGRFFFSSNPEDGPNGTLTSYSVNGNGTLTVVPGSQAVNAAPGNHPLGEAVTPDGKFLYVFEARQFDGRRFRDR